MDIHAETCNWFPLKNFIICVQLISFFFILHHFAMLPVIVHAVVKKKIIVQHYKLTHYFFFGSFLADLLLQGQFLQVAFTLFLCCCLPLKITHWPWYDGTGERWARMRWETRSAERNRRRKRLLKGRALLLMKADLLILFREFSATERDSYREQIISFNLLKRLFVSCMYSCLHYLWNWS